MPNLSNDFEVRKETLRALGGNPDGLANIYEVDLEILKLIGSGEQGIPDAPIDGVQYARQDGTWTPVESGLDWNTIKQKLAGDGVESIKFIMAGEEVILTASELKTLLNQPIHDGKYMTITADKSNSGETIIHPNIEGSLPNLNLQYRINNGSWNDFIVGTTADIHVVAGDSVQWKGNNPNGISVGYDNYFNFAISGNTVSLSGNIMSLIDGVGDALEIPNDYCFCSLFRNSDAIKTVSSDFLPATELKTWCYRDLFSGCTSLTKAPELPATTIMDGCYNGMFYNCSLLTTAPELPAKTLAPYCYGYMFMYCNSLNYVKCLATEGTINLDNWLSDVPSTGTFVKPDGVVYVTGSSGIPEGWTVKEVDVIEAPMDGKQYARQNGAWTSVKEGLTDAPSDGTQYARQNGAWTPVQTPSIGKYMTITADKSNSGETIIHPNIEGSLPNLNLQYRINNGKWNDFIVGTTDDIKIGAGDVLQFKGDNKEGVSNNGTSGYNTLNFAISGNPVALSGNIMSLIDGVGDTEVIPCSYCFCALFRNSAAIKTVSSDFLPATTLKESCYRDLFSGCQNLTQAPELPATTLDVSCYHGMFYSSRLLTTAPELPAKVLVDGCYGYMFNGSTSLNYVKCLATEGTINGDGTVPSALDNWLEGVASTGTFEKLSGVSYEAGGHHGIPEGWTVKEIYDYVEAPMDGNQYARQNGTWTVVEPGITDSPSDGKTYGRNNGAWAVVTEGITDSPSDGKTYGRNNGAWAVVEKGISDSPSDGKQYARQDGAWTVVEGITDSPSDGKTYGRNNGAWTVVTEGITDSPSDGKQYARQNGAWAVVEKGISDAQIDGVQYARQNGTWTPVEKGLDWNTIKQKLAGDGVESIKFIMGAEEVILTASEVKTLINQTVLPDAPSDGQQYARQDGSWAVVEKGITDSPSDGKTYGRNNGTWTEVESGYPIKPGVVIDNNVVSVENYGQYTRLHGNFIEIEKNNEGNIRLYDKLEVTMPGEESKTANFIDILNAGNGVVKTTNNTTLKFWKGTQQEYDAIATKDANTLYVIK